MPEAESSIKTEIESVIKESSIQIKSEVKAGMKEAIDEALSQIHEDEIQTNLYKHIAIFSSTIFFVYFLFILPDTSINPEELVQYNWINKSLIEVKITIKDYLVNLISNPSNPPSSPPASTYSTIPISPINSTDTVTISNYIKTFRSVGVQTNIDAMTVSKMVESVNIMADVLPKESANDIQQGVNKLVKTIID